MSKSTAEATFGGRQIAELQIPKVDVRKPAGEQIFQAIKQAILRMDLSPGCIISESEIGAKFGSSRTPVREALMRLREAGLVTTLPSRGNFVAKLDSGKIQEARFLREALEMANIRQLIEHELPDTAHEALIDNLNQQHHAVEACDHSLFGKFDDEFHLILAAATGYPRAAKVLEREKMVLDRLRVLSLQKADHLATLYDEHRGLFNAICDRDLFQAFDIAHIHLNSILAVLSDLEERHSEYFD
ncbi:MAG: GntR family transcriptional regulator [Stappiaceae bacterium]